MLFFSKKYLLINIIITILIFGILLFFSFFYENKYNKSKLYKISGSTMGTNYSIIYHTQQKKIHSLIKKQIKENLQNINKKMSIWDKDSEISKINNLQINLWHNISPELFFVLKNAYDMGIETKNAFDFTIGPLINLWGFGPNNNNNNNNNNSYKIPSEKEIIKVMKNIGFKNIILKNNKIFKKKHIHIDLSGIAKGYAVDIIAQILTDNNINNYLVEIGGEIVTKGYDINKKAWAIGIELPNKKNILNNRQELIEVIYLSNKAIATSGSYRNFINLSSLNHNYHNNSFDKNSNNIHHILDPRTGYSTKHNLVSVTVIAPTCIRADAIATALMVMGEKKGLQWVEENEDIEALFIIQKKDFNFIKKFSSKFLTSLKN